MCTLALYFRVFTDYPLVIAANRDESLARPSASPALLHSAPQIWGGKDLLAGGTWLGINEWGVSAAILNQHTESAPNPSHRSRGLLCLDTLTHPSATQAMQWVASTQTQRYNPFNLLVADPRSAFVICSGTQGLVARPLSPGVHLLTNTAFFAPHRQRESYALDCFVRIAPHPTSLADLLEQLRVVLSDHNAPRDPHRGMCLHLDGYGTCSSTVLAYASDTNAYRYHFAPGPPCITPYKEVLLNGA